MCFVCECAYGDKYLECFFALLHFVSFWWQSVYGTRFDVWRSRLERRVCVYVGLAWSVLFCWQTIIIIIIIVIVTKLLLLLLLLFVANGHKHTLNCFKLQTIHSKSQMNWCEKESVEFCFLSERTKFTFCAMFLSFSIDIWHVAHLQCQRYLVDAHDIQKCS